MATVLQPAYYLHHLACPHCAAPGLQAEGAGSIRCDGCGRRYPVSEDDIIEAWSTRGSIQAG
jgi:tRNA(Ile2) C34 agmatinyltransferase TiaS